MPWRIDLNLDQFWFIPSEPIFSRRNKFTWKQYWGALLLVPDFQLICTIIINEIWIWIFAVLGVNMVSPSMVSSRGSLSKQMDNIAFSDDFSSLQSIFFAIYHLAAFFGGCKLIRLPDSRYSTFYNSFFFSSFIWQIYIRWK